MKQIIGVMLLAACMTSLTLATPAQSAGAQAPMYLSSVYAGGPYRVTITARSGQVLSVLEVPSGVELSIHLSKGEFTPKQETGEFTFNGDVTIRTRPRSELEKGPILPQMMNAPLRLDVQDVVVAALPDKK